MKINDLTTPALIVEESVLRSNLVTMATALPTDRLRPHVKAHKCTTLARLQAEQGHRGFTCATIAEIEAMAAAGLGGDLLLANEVVDASRLGRLVELGHECAARRRLRGDHRRGRVQRVCAVSSSM